MADTTSTPNMNLTLPVPEERPGPTYAQDVNDALTGVDAHDHSDGKGVKVSSAGININADLPINGNNLTTARSVAFTSQGSTLGGPSDVNCLYVDGNDLWYNNGGTPVQITSGGTVNAAALVSILWAPHTVNTNLTIAPSATYITLLVDTTAARTITLPAANAVAAGRVFVIKDATGTAANHAITILRAGSDTIDGVGQLNITQDYGRTTLISDGVSKWSVVSGDALLGITRIGTIASSAILKSLTGMVSGDTLTLYNPSVAAPYNLQGLFTFRAGTPLGADIPNFAFDATNATGTWFAINFATIGTASGLATLDASSRVVQYPLRTVTDAQGLFNSGTQAVLSDAGTYATLSSGTITTTHTLNGDLLWPKYVVTATKVAVGGSFYTRVHFRIKVTNPDSSVVFSQCEGPDMFVQSSGTIASWQTSGGERFTISGNGTTTMELQAWVDGSAHARVDVGPFTFDYSLVRP